MARAIATRCCWPPESWPGIVVGTRPKTDTIQPFLGNRARFVAAHLFHLHQAEHDIARRRHMREQIELLEGHARQCPLAGDLLFALATALAADHFVADLLAVDADRAALKFFQHVDAAQHGRLAGAARSDDADDVALRSW